MALTTKLATLADVKLALSETTTRSDATLEPIIDASAQILEAMTNRPLDSVSHVERLWGAGGAVLHLPFPLQAGGTIKIEERLVPSAAWLELAASSYEVFDTYDPVSSAVMRIDSQKWASRSHPAYRVTWDAGYTEAGASIRPAAINRAVIEISVSMFRGRLGSSKSQGEQVVEAASPFVTVVVEQYQTHRQTPPMQLDAFRVGG